MIADLSAALVVVPISVAGLLQVMPTEKVQKSEAVFRGQLASVCCVLVSLPCMIADLSAALAVVLIPAAGFLQVMPTQ